MLLFLCFPFLILFYFKDTCDYIGPTRIIQLFSRLISTCHLNSSLPYVGHSVMSDSLQPRGPQPTRLLCPWDSPGKKTGMGCHSFSRGSSQPRDQTWVSCIASRFFYSLSHQGSPSFLCYLTYLPITAVRTYVF